MVRLEERARLVRDRISARGIRDPRLLRVLLDTPRHLFVPAGERAHAYVDRALPIGRGQTISQPFVVARMTALLGVAPEHRVLEIGTGSGYQTAILAALAREVWSIERIPSLGAKAAAVLVGLGYRNVRLRIGDGTLGVPEGAPFDRILVTAAAPKVPPRLLEQLVRGGVLVLPLGAGPTQSIVRLRRDGARWAQESFDRVRFVRLVGRDAHPEA